MERAHHRADTRALLGSGARHACPHVRLARGVLARDAPAVERVGAEEPAERERGAPERLGARGGAGLDQGVPELLDVVAAVAVRESVEEARGPSRLRGLGQRARPDGPIESGDRDSRLARPAERRELRREVGEGIERERAVQQQWPSHRRDEVGGREPRAAAAEIGGELHQHDRRVDDARIAAVAAESAAEW